MKYLLAALLISSGALTPKLANANNCGEQKNWDLASKKINKYRKHLESSIWIVPPSTLPSCKCVDGNSILTADQAVWVIDKFENGYFFGDAYISMNHSKLSHLQLIGSVTPLGDVYITFYPTNGEFKQTEVTTGSGKFKKIDGQYAFVMQENSPEDKSSISTPFMISVHKGDGLYKHVPGLEMSVPEFLSQFTEQ